MILPVEKFTFKLLTASFCGGADQQAAAEMRIPSIRGQVRSWHKEIAGDARVNQIWGSTGKEGSASRVGIFFQEAPNQVQDSSRPTLLPHKKMGNRPALRPDQSYELRLQRLVGCNAADWQAASKGVKLWLLMGCLGLRANRAAGSVWPVGDWVPKSARSLADVLKQLGFDWPVNLVATPDDTSTEELRRLASDTVKVPRLFGSDKPRQPSPVKFKLVELEGRVRLLVTAPKNVSLGEARQKLSGTEKAGQFEWLPL